MPVGEGVKCGVSPEMERRRGGWVGGSWVVRVGGVARQTDIGVGCGFGFVRVGGIGLAMCWYWSYMYAWVGTVFSVEG